MQCLPCYTFFFGIRIHVSAPAHDTHTISGGCVDSSSKNGSRSEGNSLGSGGGLNGEGCKNTAAKIMVVGNSSADRLSGSPPDASSPRTLLRKLGPQS